MKTSRRNFLQKLSAGSLAALTVPSLASASNAQLVSPQGAPDEKYWAGIKSQFMVPENLVMMNAANLCPSPKSVYNKMKSYQDQLSGDVSMQYRAVFADRRKKSVELLSKFINAEAAELGITRNTSESNCTIINGLDLKAGDEVILWDQNHPSNKEMWQKRAVRSGLVIKLVTTPVNPSSPAELLSAFEKAFTSKTKMIAFSHISNTTGTGLPAKQICELAKSKGAMSLVDGAQTLGFHNLNVKDLGCDFYTASTHKWLMGPLENGVLYMKKEHIEKMWPNIIGGGWHDNTNTVEDKICFLGQRNDPPTAALPEIIGFHETIGRENINQRVVDLNRMLKDKIKQRVPKANFITPISPAMSGGIVIISIPGTDPKIIVQKLYDNHGIAVATTGGVRMSPHIYNTTEDIDRLVEGLVKSIG
ncbi:MAG TPA: aminotransferase class V-fold PLP-dependent enzyme [Cyclobacteriaceae bacterium]|nr:aminotransferase class V-fold PLP-dependent enzyme [Cyclobacteriaceae bacterium]